MTRPAILNEPEKWGAVPVEASAAGAKLELWFFRSMFESNRLALFSLFGFKPADMDTMEKQRITFRHIIAARPDPTALADLVAYAEGLERRLAEAEEEFNRISCEGVTETRSLADAFDRAKSFADRGAVNARAARAWKENGDE